MPFRFTDLELEGVTLVEPRVFADERGFFMETYKHRDYVDAGLRETFVQENHSRSARGSLRGLHYQREPAAQGKLVRAIAGEIFDVAVDIRPDSPMFGRWVGVTLSAENRRMLFIPPWCAHGFCVVSDSAEVVYKTTAEYAPELESGLMWDDPGVAIVWPIADPILSKRDREWPGLAELAAVSRNVVEVS